MNVIFGGSFNPPHSGHVTAVKGLFEAPLFSRSVSKVIVLPSFGTPLKQVGVSFEQRMEMAKLAFEDSKYADQITVSDFEAKEQIQYTWQVLQRLAPSLEPAAFVIGTDQFEKLGQWARYPEVLGMTDWVVLLRKPKKLSDFADSIRKYVNEGWLKPGSNELEFKILVGSHTRKLVFAPTQAREIASTEVRALLAKGKTDEAKAIVPEKVYGFIERNHLYGT
jgi:nicotinate-nucleotide adenylyltransferase